MARVLVTGGAGSIGSCIVDVLADAGDDVLVLDNLDLDASDGPPEYLRDGVTVRFGFRATVPFPEGVADLATAPLRRRPAAGPGMVA